MDNLTGFIKDELLAHGADLVGIGDLTGLPPDVRCALPVGICIAVKYPKDVIRGISELPTEEYHDQYNRLNEKLDMLVIHGADALKALGYQAVPQTRAYVEQYETEYDSLLPHKTVATRAGLGWIGKSALLVTEKYGSMIRISSILTNAPLKTAKPVNKSKWGKCRACTEACPAGAVSGRLWDVNLPRNEFFDAVSCRKTARERAVMGFGKEITICGKCIEVCPFTRRYLDEG